MHNKACEFVPSGNGKPNTNVDSEVQPCFYPTSKQSAIINCNGLQVDESSEARQKFSNAKSISSSQFFGDQASFEKEAQVSLQKFSVSISLPHCCDVNKLIPYLI